MGLKAIYEASKKENTQQESSLENLMLRNELQKKSETISELSSQVSMLKSEVQRLADKNVMLNEADLILKENEQLKEKNEKLSEALATESRADQEILELGIENLKMRNKLREKDKQIEELQKENETFKNQIKSLESEARACKDEETLIRKKATAMYNEHKYFYDLKYRAKVVSHESFLFGCLLYGILVTLFTAVRSERFMSDFKTFFETIKVILNVAAEKLIFGASTVAKLGDKIPHPTFSLIVHWIIMFAFMAFIVGGIGFITYFLMCKLIQYYKSDLADNISLTVVLVTMAIEVFFAEKIRAVIPINLLLLFLMVHLAYISIRAYVRNDKKKRGILPST